MTSTAAPAMKFSGRIFILFLLVFISGQVHGSESWPTSASRSTNGSCTVDGVTYEDGASWPSAEGCQQCHCSSGLTFCVRTATCNVIGQCGVIVTPPGACCPVCFGCVSPSGRKTSLNETWQEDECTSCVCRDGQSKCTTSFCRTSCLHPRKVSGECCPVCDDDCHLQCHHGRVIDASGRELCECRRVPEREFHHLRVTSDDGDDEDDGRGYVTAAGNEALNCPKVPCTRMCPHGFQTDQRGCPICKCQRCRPLHDCHKKCALGLVHDSRGCPTCQCRSPFNPETTSATASHRCTSSNDGNVSYAYGERWQVDDCTSCICHHGGPTCTEMICPLPCHNAIFIPGQCCPVCDNDVTRTTLADASSIVNQRNEDNANESEGQTLLMVVVVCVALVAGLILIVSVLALCVARQCRRLQLHEENMAAAAVKLTAVNRLRPKSTNLDYQYNLYMHRYREPSSTCWSPLESTDKSDLNEARDKEEGASSNGSDSPLLVQTG